MYTGTSWDGVRWKVRRDLLGELRIHLGPRAMLMFFAAVLTAFTGFGLTFPSTAHAGECYPQGFYPFRSGGLTGGGGDTDCYNVAGHCHQLEVELRRTYGFFPDDIQAESTTRHCGDRYWYKYVYIDYKSDRCYRSKAISDQRADYSGTWCT